ncbi:MAG: ABC transporter ATP-binding protein [Lentisphaeria bacterium]|jgi:iron(III) transport system ATP-binding protein
MKITIANVSCAFGDVRAVDGVSLSIADGELFFLLGASGCGKTTLLRAIAGFQGLQGGTIHFGDEEMTHVPPHRRNTGLMFQGYALWPHLTVAENVAFGLEQRGVPKAELAVRVRRALEQVRIADLAERKPNQLSGGQQQRVALARTLVVQPAVLLLDEPLANLDAQLRLEMRTEIRRLCKESGLTAVYVTHDQKEALSMADRLAVMEQGRLRQVGAPREVYRRPADAFVAGFIGEVAFFPGRIAAANADQAGIQTPAGNFLGAHGAAHFSTGQEVLVGVRPESWHLEPAGAAVQPNTLDGTVRETTYLGGTVQLLVAVENLPAPVSALVQNPRVWPAPGEHVRLRVAPEDILLLPAGRK